MKKLESIDGETLMSRQLQPLNFVVDTLMFQGLHILAGSPKVGKTLCIARVPPCEVLCALLRREAGMYPASGTSAVCGLCGPLVGSAQLRHSRDAPSGRKFHPTGGPASHLSGHGAKPLPRQMPFGALPHTP